MCVCIPHPYFPTLFHCIEVNLYAGMVYPCSLNFYRKTWVTKSRGADFSRLLIQTVSDIELDPAELTTDLI